MSATATQAPDIEFLLDASGSMGMYTDTPGNKTRWDYSKEFVFGLASAASEVDPDGITVMAFASSPRKAHENVVPMKVAEVYTEAGKPNGSTNTAGALKARFDAYLARKAAGTAKPTVMFVMTDGTPDDAKLLAKTISDFTQQISGPQEVAVQFLQVGKDADAERALKALDTDLKGAKHDIVGVTHLGDTETIDFGILLAKAQAGN